MSRGSTGCTTRRGADSRDASGGWRVPGAGAGGGGAGGWYLRSAVVGLDVRVDGAGELHARDPVTTAARKASEARVAELQALVRGSRIACFGSGDLVRVDEAGSKRWLMQADEVPYLHPGRVSCRLRSPASPPPAQNWCTKRNSARVRSYSWPDALLVRSSWVTTTCGAKP